MSSNKIDEALKVSEDILDSFEDHSQKVSNVLLKCLKLARLMEDENAIEWISCELHGYKSSKNGIPSDLFELAAFHGRENNKTEENESRTIFTELASELEDKIESSKTAIGSFTTSGASVAGEYSHIAMSSLTNSVARENNKLRNIITSSEKKLSILRGEYYNYALEVNMQLKFSNKVEEIFNDYRINVDSQLVSLTPKSIKKLSSIYSRLAEDDVESWSQASTTCRKLIKEFGDSLFEKVYPNNKLDKIKVKSGKEIDITGDKYVNRISVSLDKIIQNDMKRDNIMLSISWIESINERICKGVHNDVTYDEIRSTIIHLYIMLADILNDFEVYNSNLKV